MPDDKSDKPKQRVLPAAVRGEIRRQQMAPAGYRYTNGRPQPSMPKLNLPPIEDEK